MHITEYPMPELFYYIVCPMKYKRTVLGKEMDKTLREVCAGIAEREIFKSIPSVEKGLKGEGFWSEDYFISSVDGFEDDGDVFEDDGDELEDIPL